jgi:hypothetical protein
MEEATYARRVLKDDSSKELMGVNRKQVERLVYIYRQSVHQKYQQCHRLRDSVRLSWELAFKLRELSEMDGIEANFPF